MDRLILLVCVMKMVDCVNYNINFLKDNQPDNYLKITEDNMRVIKNSPTFIEMENFLGDGQSKSKDYENSFKLDFSFESFLTLSKLYNNKPIENEINIELFNEVIKLADFLGYDDFQGIDVILTNAINKNGNKRILTSIFKQNLSVEYEKTLVRKTIRMKIESLGLSLKPNYFQENVSLSSSYFNLILIPLSNETTIKQITIDEGLINKMNRLDCLEYLDLILEYEGIESVILTEFSLEFLKSLHRNRLFFRNPRNNHSNVRFECFDCLSHILGVISEKNITHLKIENSSLTTRHCKLILNLRRLKYFNLDNSACISTNGYSRTYLYMSVLNKCNIESIGWLSVGFDANYRMIMSSIENSESLKILKLQDSEWFFNHQVLSSEQIHLQQIFLHRMIIKIDLFLNSYLSLESLNVLKFIDCNFIISGNFQNDQCLPNIKELSLIDCAIFDIEEYEFIRKSFPNLEKLEIISHYRQLSLEKINILENLPLKDINISRNELTVSDIEKINLLKLVENLNIECCDLDVGDFIPLKNNKNLKTLKAKDNKNFGKNDLEALLEIKTLEYLNISSKSLSVEMVQNAILERKNITVILNNHEVVTNSPIN